MKKLVLLAILILSCHSASSEQLRFTTKEAGGWVLGYDNYYESYMLNSRNKNWLATYDEQSKMFYMHGPLVTNDKVWMGISVARGSDLPSMPGYKSMIGIQQFDCKKKMLRIVQMHAFKDYWGKGQGEFMNNPIDWIKPDPRSFVKNVMDLACRRIELRKMD